MYIFQVSHLEPWEKNSRKLAGQVGMCAGVSYFKVLVDSTFILQEYIIINEILHYTMMK